MEDKRIKSIFGAYADKLQLIIDKKLEKFSPTWFTNYFTFTNPTIDLTFMTAVGRSRVEAAATIVDREADAPLRSRPNIEKYSGEVPAIKQAFKLKESDIRTWLALQNMPVVGNSQKNQVLDLIWGDTLKCGNAAMKKIDYMCLEAVSTGQITVTTTNNPDGIVADTIDLLVPSGHKSTVDTLWSEASTATPVDDITSVVQDMDAEGIRFEKMLMAPAVFWKMQKTTQVKEQIYEPNAKKVPTISEINEFLSSQDLPIVELVNETIGIESDGVISNKKPFAQDVVSFIPAGGLGVIHNAYAIEQLRPVGGITYGTYNRALISKWSQAHPFAEYTQVELNAFPGLEVADFIYIMTVL